MNDELKAVRNLGAEATDYDALAARVAELTKDRDDCLAAREHYAGLYGEALVRVAEPDWSSSETAQLQGWKNPLLSMDDRLLIADGAVRFRDEMIANLRRQLAELERDAARWHYVKYQGDDTHWLNLLRVDLEHFGGSVDAAVDALIDGGIALAQPAKESE